MIKKVSYLLSILLVSGFLIWEYKVNIIVWTLPKVMNFVNPIQENIPTNWTEGPSEKLDIKDSRPNIILILADDMGYNDISLHNGGAADGSLQTPHIDSLATNGVWFSKGYAANATCAPSRASIMTGRYATRFGFEFTPVPDAGRTVLTWLAEEDDSELRSRIDKDLAMNLPPFLDQGMPSEQITIAEILKDAGYYTAHIGKWHLGHASGMDPQSQGFVDSLSLAGSYYLPEDHPQVVNAKFDTSIDKMVWSSGQYAAQFNGGDFFEPDKYVTDYYTDEALKVIEKNQNRPFFIYLSHWAIHNPLQALRDDVEKQAQFGPTLMFDVSLPISQMEEYVNKVNENLNNHWANYHFIVWGHLADGNLHLVAGVGDLAKDTIKKIETSVYDPLEQIGGSVSAEHGIGIEKKPYLHLSRSQEEINYMKMLKKTFDPKSILNPGLIF